MKSNYLLWLIVAGLVLLGVWYWNNRSAMAPVDNSAETMMEDGTMMSPEPIVVELAEQNDLGQSGTATLSEDPAGQLIVLLALTGGTFTAAQPAHIHMGACPDPGAVVYPLNNVVDGESITTLPTTWAELVEAGEPLAINVHKSAAESSIYTACGDLPIAADTMMMEDDADMESTNSMEY